MTSHEIVMPFVLCETNGGPFDDEAFVAGWDCGALEAELTICLRLGATPKPRWVKTVILPQLDLIAMDTRFIVTKGDVSPEGEWIHVTFHTEPIICTCPSEDQ